MKNNLESLRKPKKIGIAAGLIGLASISGLALNARDDTRSRTEHTVFAVGECTTNNEKSTPIGSPISLTLENPKHGMNSFSINGETPKDILLATHAYLQKRDPNGVAENEWVNTYLLSNIYSDIPTIVDLRIEENLAESMEARIKQPGESVQGKLLLPETISEGQWRIALESGEDDGGQQWTLFADLPCDNK